MRSANLAFIAAFTTAAWAMPVAPFNSDSPQNCSQANVERAAEGLVQLASYIPQRNARGEEFDPRGSITSKAADLNLSAATVAKIRKTCGYVFCGIPEKESIDDGGAGCLVGESGMQLLTARHLLYKEGTSIARRSHCFFQNQEIPFKRVELDMERSEFMNSGLNSLPIRNEMQIVKLKEKITDEIPFPFSKSSLKNGDSMILVSASQRIPGIDRLQPIVQQCHAMETFRGVGPTQIWSNCSTTRGASGSIGFVIENGALTVAAVVIGSGSDEEKCDYGRNSHCYAYALGVNPTVVQQLVSFEGGKPIETARGPDPILRVSD